MSNTTTNNVSLPQDEKPVYDFSSLSWGDTDDIEALSMEFRAAQRDFDVDRVKRIQSQIREKVAGIVVSLPRSYLVSNAPDNINFKDPSSLRKYLRRDKVQELVQAFIDPGAISGNSSIG